MAKLSRALVNDVLQAVSRYSRYHQSILTIEQFTRFGKTANIEESYQFLRHEVPVRLAHIMQEIEHLPKNLKSMPSVELVHGWYIQSFADLMEYQNEEICNDITLERFTQSLYHIKRRHDNTVETMAQGIMELRESQGEKAIAPAVQYFLDRFYMNRIGIRLLMTQHLALFEESLARGPKTNYIGLFDANLHPKSVVKDACSNASMLCSHFYFDAPDVQIREHNTQEEGKEIVFSYVPSHLYHILFEILKNAMRATVEKHGSGEELPKVEIDIVKGMEDLSIRISDLGGGIQRSKMENLFKYHYTTASPPEHAGGMAALAGYGYGLPLSRIYAKYFGGDIQLTSMDGYGTQAYIFLKVLSANAHEVIPLYNTAVANAYKEDINNSVARDWSCDSFYDGQGHSYIRPVYTKKNGKNK